MKKKVKSLTQLFDYKAAGLTVYESPDGRLMVAELVGQHSGRIYEVAELFRYAENMKRNYEEKSFKDDLRDEFQNEIGKIKYQLEAEKSNISLLLDLASRKPRFGWRK